MVKFTDDGGGFEGTRLSLRSFTYIVLFLSSTALAVPVLTRIYPTVRRSGFSMFSSTMFHWSASLVCAMVVLWFGARVLNVINEEDKRLRSEIARSKDLVEKISN